MKGVEKLKKLVENIKIGMLTSAEDDNTLRSRPMMTCHVDDDGTIWFFTEKGSPKTEEISHQLEVNMSYAHPDKEIYVSISGLGEIVTDKQKITDFWSPMFKAWFPKGVDDPSLALIKINPTLAEYWDAPSSKMVQIVGMAKAAMTGHKYKPADHEKIKF